MSDLLQFLMSGLTVGAVYALLALGFTIIFNASDVVNFAQGEFVMLGGMGTVFGIAAGLPVPLAALAAILGTAFLGVALNKLAIEPARGAPVVSVIIITIGAAIFIQGAASVLFDKQIHRYPGFSGERALHFGGATLLPQSLWVMSRCGLDLRRPLAVLHPQPDWQGHACNLEQPIGGGACRYQHALHHDSVLWPGGGNRRICRRACHSYHHDRL
jgi:hypothetical protein